MLASVSHARTWFSLGVWAFVASLWLTGAAVAVDDKKERDLFDYEAQKAAANVKKIVFVADTAPHGGRGNHEERTSPKS